MRIGALEAGGTKMVCAVGLEDGTILEQVSIPTRTPEETIPAMLDFFRGKEIETLGIAAFGPVDLNRDSKTYGYILDTPKTDWKFCDLAGSMARGLQMPVGLDTDVNGSCLGEMTYGCAKGLSSVLYLTVGTGIGAGIGINGRLLHGMLHPEAGHLLLRRHPKDPTGGFCPFHEDCLEGLASGPAIEKRWGRKAQELADTPLVWEIESYYLAQAMVSYILTLSPQKIILGGGVMEQRQLFPMIREKTEEMLGGYIRTAELAHMDTYIVPASLEGRQGIMGCLRLGFEACR